jgi:hypothetical protein
LDQEAGLAAVSIAAPAKDANGRVLPHDHPELKGDGRLIRRVSQHQVVSTPKGERLSTAVLEPSTPEYDPHCGLSVDLEQLLLAEGVHPVAHVAKAHGAIALTVASFRDRKFMVGSDPLADNPYHGNVWQDAKAGSKLTRGTQKALLREAVWLVAIDGVAIVHD